MIPTATAGQLDAENPWPGLESFREDAQAFFFGRDRDAQVLLHQVLDAPATVLYGRSGLGKTSLLQAGLFPLLRDRDYLPVYVRFDLSQNPGSLSQQLHRAVCESIRADVPDAMLPADDESLWEYLHRNDFELWSERNYPLTPVVVLDQFEELFTLGARVPDSVEAFRNEFGDLAENRIPGALAARIDADATLADRYDLRSGNYKILISLREDFLPDLQEWCGLIPTLGRSRVRLRPLSADDAFDAVYKPARHLMTETLARRVVGIIAGEGSNSGSDGEPVDADRGLDAGGTGDVEPPLLSLVCRELNEARIGRGMSQFDAELIEETGHETLSNYYSTCVSGMRPEVAQFIETELISENGEYRENFIRDEAVPERLTEDELTQLISSRLVRLEDQYGVRRIELTHDVLTRAVRDHRDRRLAAEQEAAQVAEAQHREAELEHERERRRVSERAARRFRWVSAALALVCVGALVAVGVAVKERNDANARFRVATADWLYGNSQLMLTGQSPRGSDDKTVMQMMLAALAIEPNDGDPRYGLLTVLNQERDLLKVIDTPSRLQSVAISPDGTRIATGSTDKTIQLWDAGSGKEIGPPLQGHEDWVNAVVFSPDGGRIASASGDKTVRLWDVVTGKQIGPSMRHDGPVAGVAFSPDGSRIASGSDDKTVRLWDVATGREIAKLLHDNTVLCVAFSPDGTRIASGGVGKTVQLWDAGTFREVGVLKGHEGLITGIAISRDNERLVSASGDGTVRMWDARSWQPMLGHDKPAVAGFSPDGSRISSGSKDGTVRRWDAETLHQIGGSLSIGGDGAAGLYPLGDDRLVSVGKVNGKDAVRVWDAGTGNPIGEPLYIDTDLFAWTTDGDMVVGKTGPDTLRAFSTDTSRAIGPPIKPGGDSSIFDVSFDGRLLVTVGSDSIVHLWDPRTGAPVGEPMKSAEWLTSVAVSPDGRRVATGDVSYRLRLWDTSTGQPVGNEMYLESFGYALRFSPDGRIIASGGDDGTIRLWDADDQTQLGAALNGHTQAVTSLEFSPDGNKLVSASRDDTIRLWPVPTLSPVAARDALCAKITHNMSHDQWNILVSPKIGYIEACPGLPDSDFSG